MGSLWVLLGMFKQVSNDLRVFVFENLAHDDLIEAENGIFTS